VISDREAVIPILKLCLDHEAYFDRRNNGIPGVHQSLSDKRGGNQSASGWMSRKCGWTSCGVVSYN